MSNKTKKLLKELVAIEPDIAEFLGNDNPSIYTAWDLTELTYYKNYSKGTFHLKGKRSEGMS
jgi:hypothetical protein